MANEQSMRNSLVRRLPFRLTGEGSAGWRGLTVTTVLMLVIALNLAYGLLAIYDLRSRLTIGPGATVSDLYPRWRGTRDLLLDGTNPYTPEQTLIYEYGYYGGPHPPTSVDAGWYKGFSYPLYLSVLIAPLALLPFPLAQAIVAAGIIVGTLWSALRWTRLINWPTSRRSRRWIAALCIAAPPAALLVALQQLTGVVMVLLVLAAVTLQQERFRWAGAIFAVAMIKPQLAGLAFLGALIYTAHMRKAKVFLAAFTVVFAGPMGISLALQPDWPLWFRRDLRTYQEGNELWGISSLVPSSLAQLAALATVATASIIVCAKRLPVTHAAGASLHTMLALMIAATLVINSGSLMYNLVLLFIPVTVVARDLVSHPRFWVRFPARVGIGLLLAALLAGSTLALLIHVIEPARVFAAINAAYIFAPLPLWLALMLHPWSSTDDPPA